MTMRKKHEFDREVAEETGLKVRDVGRLTTAFLAKVAESIANGDEVVLLGFGRFRLKESPASNRDMQVLTRQPVKGKKAKKVAGVRYKVTRVFRVHFKKSEVINRLLRLKHGPSGHLEKK